MFDHMGFSVSDLKKFKQFYEWALAPLGIRLMVDSEEYQAAGFGREGERPRFWIEGGKSPRTVAEDELHLCFTAKSREEVRAFYTAALEAGARDHGKPGLRPEYHPHYYGAFVLDPDGNNIEACCHQPEESS